jgi:hypothetical protein
MIEPADPNIDFEIVCILVFPNYYDNISTSEYYLRSNLGSNFFVQTNVITTNTEFETMNNLNIFMRISNDFLPNLPVTYADGDYKDDCHTSALTSHGYIERVSPNLHSTDLLYSFKLSLLIEFYEGFSLFLTPIFFILK